MREIYKNHLYYGLVNVFISTLVWGALGSFITLSKGSLLPEDITIYEFIREIIVSVVSIMVFKYTLSYRVLKLLLNIAETVLVIVLTYIYITGGQYIDYGTVFYIYGIFVLPINIINNMVSHNTREAILTDKDNVFMVNYRKISNLIETAGVLAGTGLVVALVNVMGYTLTDILPLVLLANIIGVVYENYIWYKYVRHIVAEIDNGIRMSINVIRVIKELKDDTTI